MPQLPLPAAAPGRSDAATEQRGWDATRAGMVRWAGAWDPLEHPGLSGVSRDQLIDRLQRTLPPHELASLGLDGPVSRLSQRWSWSSLRSLCRQLEGTKGAEGAQGAEGAKAAEDAPVGPAAAAGDEAVGPLAVGEESEEVSALVHQPLLRDRLVMLDGILQVNCPNALGTSSRPSAGHAIPPTVGSALDAFAMTPPPPASCYSTHSQNDLFTPSQDTIDTPTPKSMLQATARLGQERHTDLASQGCLS